MSLSNKVVDFRAAQLSFHTQTHTLSFSIRSLEALFLLGMVVNAENTADPKTDAESSGWE